jgi:hypothetical protein
MRLCLETNPVSYFSGIKFSSKKGGTLGSVSQRFGFFLFPLRLGFEEAHPRSLWKCSAKHADFGSSF